MKKWHNKKMCEDCRRFKTWGGVKLLFGLIKIKKWGHNYCECNDTKDSSEDNKCQKNG